MGTSRQPEHARRAHHARFRVAISGSYGGLNLGDEAILASMLSQMRASLPVDVTVFSRNPEDTLQRHQVERALPIREMSRTEARDEIAQKDPLVLGGGGILYDAEASIYMREVTLAHEIGVPVMVYAVSAGPLQDPTARSLVRDALNGAAVVSVRDRQGRQLLEEIGVHRQIHLTADPAVLLQPEPLPPEALKREGLDDCPRLIGISVREPGPAAPDIDIQHYHGLLANAADFVVDRLDADIVFVPMERSHMDMQHSHAVISCMRRPQRATVLRGAYTPGQIMQLIAHCEFAIGMRLHFLIFAAHEGVPFVALPYSSKVGGFLEDMKMPTPPMHNWSVGNLIAHLDRCWDMRASIRERIRETLPVLQSRARDNHNLLVDLLKRR
jgi:polysaccharide pyruvyl transferase CsaB